MSLLLIDRDTIFKSLKATACPACARPKAPHRSVCLRCWRFLPAYIQNGLRLEFGTAYIGAWRGAMSSLGRKKIYDPDAPLPYKKSSQEPTVSEMMDKATPGQLAKMLSPDLVGQGRRVEEAIQAIGELADILADMQILRVEQTPAVQELNRIQSLLSGKK